MNASMIAVAGEKLRVGTSQGRDGTRPLLVFNGLGADLDHMGAFVESMERVGIGIISFDVPGIGGSSVPAFPYRFARLAQLAGELLKRLRVEGPVDVAGMSWGGALAQEFTHRYPQSVRRLILAATSGGSISLPGRLPVLTKLLDPRVYVDPNFMSRIGGELYGGKIRADTESLRDFGTSLRPLGCALQLLAITGWTSVGWLHTVRQPTLIMMGTDDPIVPLANGRLLARLIPNSRLVTIADGHLFFLTSAAQCAPIIARFLIDAQWPVDTGDGVPTATGTKPHPW